MTVGEGGIRIITILITITTPIATTLIITIIDTATTGRTTIAHTTTIVGITEQRAGTRLSRGRGHRHDPGRHACAARVIRFPAPPRPRRPTPRIAYASFRRQSAPEVNASSVAAARI